MRDVEAPVNIHEELGLRSGADDDLIRAGDTPPDLDFDLAPLESDQMCEQKLGHTSPTTMLTRDRRT